MKIKKEKITNIKVRERQFNICTIGVSVEDNQKKEKIHEI